MSQQSFAVWDGDGIEGGEPAWFKQAAAEGRITRSCDGCGDSLFLKGPRGLEVVAPGGTVQRDRDGTIRTLTLDAALGTLAELSRSAARGEAREDGSRRSA